jgi:hypothetical protein
MKMELREILNVKFIFLIVTSLLLYCKGSIKGGMVTISNNDY